MVGQDVMRCLMALGLVLQGLSFGAQAAPGGAVELYRYVNDKGVVVLDRQGVPPQYIGKGYQVLNDQGRVIRTVPPAPTAEELRQRKAAQAQASSDAQLLRLYSSLEDVDRARERRLAELDGLSSVARGNLQSLKLQQANLQGQAANQERAGRPVAQALVDQLDDLKQEEKRLQGEIGRFQKAREDAERTYAADRARLPATRRESLIPLATVARTP